jgi:hypothetical protein
MATTFVHGRNTVFKVATKDLSPVTKTSSFEYSADVHDVTGYGATGHAKQGGLTDGKFTASGTYDSTAVTGSRVVLEPLVGTTVAILRQPEGTATGKPQDSFSAVLSKYVETNPVDDMITWSADFEISGAVTTTVQ